MRLEGGGDGDDVTDCPGPKADEDEKVAVGEDGSGDQHPDQSEEELEAELEGLLAAAQDKYRAKLAIRETNLDPDRDRNKPKGKLDSTVKKNTAYVKKLSVLKETQRDAFEKELAGLNLRFV